MNRVLVTGATGLIGWHTLPLLTAAGYEVHALSSGPPPSDALTASWHQADLLDQEQVKDVLEVIQPTHLLHLAWYTPPGKYWDALENFAWVRASLVLAELFIAQGGQRLVSAGTCAEYDWRYGYCSEAVTPLASATTYGVCKNALRELLDALAMRTGVSSAWGRVFLLYGPREHPNRLVSSVALALLDGRPALCSHGKQLRDFMYVEDVAAAFVALLGSEVVGAVNIASGAPVKVSDLVYTLADQQGRRDLIQLGAMPTPPNEPRLLLADTTRLEEEVGWVPRYTHEHGLAQTLAWWKTHRDQSQHARS